MLHVGVNLTSKFLNYDEEACKKVQTARADGDVGLLIYNRTFTSLVQTLQRRTT